jgi:metal-dependent amidase/aminoacylase/carboxypeptidase family protein
MSGWATGRVAGGCTLHNPHYDFNDDVLALGVAYWVRLVEAVLSARG